MKKIISCALALLLGFTLMPRSLFAEDSAAETSDVKPSAFKLCLPLEAGLAATGASFWITSAFVDRGPSGGNWQRNAFDKKLMANRYHKGWALASDFTVGLLSASPLFFALPLFNEDQVQRRAMGRKLLTYAAMYAEAALLTEGSKELVKSLVPRNRPYVYKGSSRPSDASSDYWHSFPSGHTSFGFMEAGLISAIMTFDYPDSFWKWPVIIVSYSAATSIAAMRVASGMHFATDVISGAALGSVYGWGIPLLHLVF
jgi:membrane-associated phospholipid phosphatase